MSPLEELPRQELESLVREQALIIDDLRVRCGRWMKRCERAEKEVHQLTLKVAVQ